MFAATADFPISIIRIYSGRCEETESYRERATDTWDD